MSINIIGGGLAGSECAYFLANHGIKVNLYEMKPKKFSPAHKNKTLAEIVCSNSLKNEDVLTSSGLLKAEMDEFGSLILNCARQTRVPAGSALAVDREQFSLLVDKTIRENPNITIYNEEITDLSKIDEKDIWVIATGPLTSEGLSNEIKRLLGEEDLYFFDASAPIVTSESLDHSKCFVQDRYGELGKGDYLNVIMNKEQYLNFYTELVNAETVELKDFENSAVFESCMPVEVLAKRGEDALRYGPLKPVGFNQNPFGIKPYAVVQLRKENTEESSYNLVGFQTNLKFGEQKRVFSLLPGLENAEFIKYGVMHRNSYINAPKHINSNFALNGCQNIYFAGQISGVEGYVESTASGLMVALSIYARLKGKEFKLDAKTMLGAISSYISNPANASNFQPMNSNYGIIEALEGKYKSKEEKRKAIYDRSMQTIKNVKREIED